MEVPAFDLDSPDMKNDLNRIVFESAHGPWSFSSRRPTPDLAFDIDLFWETHGFTDYSREKILPTGCADLIINLGGPHDTLKAEDLSPSGTYYGAWLAGLQESAIIAAPTYDTAKYGSLLVGVTLRPRGIRHLIGLGGRSFTSNVVELVDFLDPKTIRSLREKLFHSNNTSSRFVILENFLRSLSSKYEREISPCVAWSLDLIENSDGDVLVEDLCSITDVSRKHLSQKFQDEVGLSPKRYARLLRFAAVIEKLSAANRVNWTQIALDAGYYDQAHFVREFKLFAGQTPTDFMRERSPDGKTIVY